MEWAFQNKFQIILEYIMIIFNSKVYNREILLNKLLDVIKGEPEKTARRLKKEPLKVAPKFIIPLIH